MSPRQQPKRPVPEVSYAPRNAFADVNRLYTLPRGSLYLGIYDGRPCFFVDESSMTGWVTPSKHEELEQGMAKAFCFQSDEDRWAYITGRGWERLQENYLRYEMFALYEQQAAGRGSLEHFEQCYEDAKTAIQNLPCRDCGRILWPEIRKPAHGSAEWWADPSPFFGCRQCHRELADAWTYSGVKATIDELPEETVE